MQNTIFKSRLILALIAGGILGVSAFALAGVFTTSESATDNVVPNSLTGQMVNGHKKSVDHPLVTDVPEAEYRERLARIKQFADAGNFEYLVKEGDEILQIWGRGGGERFARLTFKLINALGLSRISDKNPTAWDLREKYALAALAVSESYGIESELNLVGQLRSFALVPSFSEAEASKLRHSSKLWLHLLARIESERDPTVNLDPHQSLPMKLTPPDDLYSGGIVNPLVKAKFEADVAAHNEKLKKISYQFQLRNLSEIADRIGTRFLANVYSRPPFSREELGELLSEYPITERLRINIMKSRDKIVGAEQ